MIIQNKLNHSTEYIADKLTEGFNAFITKVGINNRAYTVTHADDRIELTDSTGQVAFSLLVTYSEVDLYINTNDSTVHDALLLFLSQLSINNKLIYNP
ncbi:hypothetical protein [Pedobacter sp. MR2016-24]|uniref:hypothetical protein n=1 Tax=Pedobacter sp. MR2016-24 TaxID=2994466 RepID=UPI0022465550|nr:hypothetical protein [Pedobacter sp. MR2016-24]MCX2486584.1 hypothetical protein [Pedobacter sp. MR2016-24]